MSLGSPARVPNLHSPYWANEARPSIAPRRRTSDIRSQGPVPRPVRIPQRRPGTGVWLCPIAWSAVHDDAALPEENRRALTEARESGGGAGKTSVANGQRWRSSAGIKPGVRNRLAILVAVI